jgi:tetratricopeptide (TPR) repeat protein
MDKLDALQNMLEESPNDSFLRFALAMEWARKGDYNRSADLFQQLCKMDPDYVGAYLHWGRLCLSMNRKEEAIAIYQKGIEVAGRLADFHAKAELQGALQDLDLDE